jgi:hypothetical protein
LGVKGGLKRDSQKFNHKKQSVDQPAIKGFMAMLSGGAARLHGSPKAKAPV